MRQVLELEFRKIQDRLRNQKIEMVLSEEAIERLVDLGSSERFGARGIRRVLEEEIENRAAEYILDQKIKPGDSVLCCLQEGNFVFVPQKKTVVAHD